MGELVAVLPERVEGLLEAGDGLSAVAQEVVDGAEAVQRVGYAVSVAEIAEGSQCVLAAGEGLLIVAQVNVVQANVVEGSGLASLAAGLAIQA